ncbi:hypothetical protein [Synechococcus sp. MU1611]|uniref:hypothetical protein n=1 Tax=Synechococcus sp. MU1611 TaxID=2508345 RepID=UPI001CF90CB0|nr:hypothetical protein [Synechococcus sp. MU1611]MCB4412020.1 hypothetical protein [Synechococcus sp. MU1611]
MTPINYLPPDSGLPFWKKQESPVFGHASGSSFSTSLLQQGYVIPLAMAGLTVALSWAFPFFNNRSAISQISNLEFEHSQYLQLTARISASEQEFDQQKSDIRSFSALFTSSASVYPFAFNLQRFVPRKVNFNTFVLDNSSFNICAFGPDYESLEDLIDLLKAMPAVDPNSVRFTNMASDLSALGSSGCQSLSSSQPVSVSLRGKFLPATTSDLEDLYSAASDYGQYNKLRLYNTLLKKIGGV